MQIQFGRVYQAPVTNLSSERNAATLVGAFNKAGISAKAVNTLFVGNSHTFVVTGSEYQTLTGLDDQIRKTATHLDRSPKDRATLAHLATQYQTFVDDFCTPSNQDVFKIGATGISGGNYLFARKCPENLANPELVAVFGENFSNNQLHHPAD